LRSRITAGTHKLDEAHIKAELFLGFRDKKQVKKLAKEKEVKSQSRQRNSLYNRIFNRSSETPQVEQAHSSSDSSDNDDASGDNQLNRSDD